MSLADTLWSMSLSVHQASHELMRERLREALLAAVASEGGGGLGCAQWRASAALHVLLTNHDIDRWGRCRSCRRPGALVGRRRRVCRVYLAARCYLYQPEQVLLRHLTGELTQDPTPPGGAEKRPDPDATEAVLRIAAEPVDALTERPHTPAVPPPLASSSGARTGRPAPGHGGAGEPAPRRPRSRRAPFAYPAPAGTDSSAVMARVRAR